MKDSTLVILGETDSFTRWDASLRARLAKRDLTGHVIHDDIDVDPVVRPKEPVGTRIIFRLISSAIKGITEIVVVLYRDRTCRNRVEVIVNK